MADASPALRRRTRLRHLLERIAEERAGCGRTVARARGALDRRSPAFAAARAQGRGRPRRWCSIPSTVAVRRSRRQQDLAPGAARSDQQGDLGHLGRDPPETAAKIGVANGQPVKVQTEAGSVEAAGLPLCAGCARTSIAIPLGQGSHRLRPYRGRAGRATPPRCWSSRRTQRIRGGRLPERARLDRARTPGRWTW